MTKYISPGVYIEEIERGPRPIEGVPTSTAAILGVTERGPARPRMISSHLEFERKYGGAVDGRPLPVSVRGFFDNGGRWLFVCRIANAAASPARADAGDYLLAAVGAGAWGNRVWARLEDGATLDANNVPVGFRLRVAYFAAGSEPYDCFDPRNAANPVRPQVIEEYDDLEVDPHSSAYFGRYLDPDSERPLQPSALVVLARKEGATALAPAHFNGVLAGGTDGGAPDAADFRGWHADSRRASQGLAALEEDACRGVAVLCAPGADIATQRALVAHCEQHFRFAILDAARGATAESGLTPRADIADSGHAAFYSPWIEVADPASGARTFVPPCGHVLGVYARTDLERGVFKPPANEVLRGALGLERSFDAATQGLLTPRGVNLIREFPGRGILLWSARTLSSHAEWKYVNVRRLITYLERSIDEGTRWVVFEPNTEPTWARVREMIETFLLLQWRAGALQGSTPEQAFFVKCDRTTMSQADIDMGRLNCLVGVAALRPAEFVIIAICH